ncbi:hypothetical protein ACI2OX_11530 [Bacillus sp. N9]
MQNIRETFTADQQAILNMDATELAEKIRNGLITSVRATTAYISTYNKYNRQSMHLLKVDL